MDLITDRTHADCERAAYLLDRVHAGETLTDAERAEYFGGLRGCYTMAHDWNRVESVVKEISDRHGMGLQTKTDWTYNDVATKSEIERYINNIGRIWELVRSRDGAPDRPSAGDWIDYRTANDIETILKIARGNTESDRIVLATCDGEPLRTSDGKRLVIRFRSKK